MGKFYGQIGYATQVESSPGLWEDVIVEKSYTIDELKIVGKIRDGASLNSTLTVDNRLSLVADPFANEKFSSMRYVKWNGALWEITSVEVQRPRLILTIGGIYNGQTA